MRFLRWALGLLALLAVLYLYFATVHPHHRVGQHAFFEAPGPWALAHRGGLGLWPENTLYAFEHARDLGVDVLEMDLRTTVDDHIVVIHDETVDRTTDGRGRVSDSTLDELRGLDAGYRFRDEDGAFTFRAGGLRVPTLREVLTALESSRLNLEMKEFTPEEAISLCRMLQELDAEARVLVASFSHETMVAFREECPSVATSATLREALAFYQLHRLRLGSLYRGPAVAFQVPDDPRVIEPGFFERTRAANIQVHVWTINEASDMKRLLDMGVQGILTDYPDRLLRQMGRPQGGSLSVASPTSSIQRPWRP